MSSTTASATATSSATTSSSSTSCVTGIPDKNGWVPPEDCNAIYLYHPSFAWALIFACLFGIVTVVHIIQAFWSKKTFCWVIIMGALWETGSFTLRTYSSKHQQNTTIYTISFLLVLLAPLLINAFDYMILGRMVYFYLPDKKLFIRATKFSSVFVWLDILAFLVQLGGGMIVSGTNVAPKTMQLGIHIYMGGIGLQQFFILLFLCLVIAFHRRMITLKAQGAYVKPGWFRILCTLYVSLALITGRIIYRLTEYARGESPSNPLPYHEFYFYVLDATPMFLAILIMCITHPGHVFVGPDSEFPKLSRKEKKAAKRAEKFAKKLGKDHEKLLDSHSAGYEFGDLEEGRSSTATPLPPSEQHGQYGQYVNVDQGGEQQTGYGENYGYGGLQPSPVPSPLPSPRVAISHY